MGFNSAFKGLKLFKNPGNGRLNNLNDPVLNVLIFFLFSPNPMNAELFYVESHDWAAYTILLLGSVARWCTVMHRITTFRSTTDRIYHCVKISYSIQYSNMLCRFVA